MTGCHLPIDWLDLLEGRPSPAEHAHLENCASCRAVVAALSGSLEENAVLTVGRDLTLGGAVRMRHEVPDTDAFGMGQIWWLSTAANSDRLPVLVLAVEDHEEQGSPLADVVPLWTDQDNATSADLLLDEQDSTMGVRWRVAFRRQTLVGRQHLRALAGTLTQSGMALIAEALTGNIPADRSGWALESEHDPRLAADAWMDSTLAAASADIYNDAGDEFPGLTTGMHADFVGADPEAGVVLIFQVKTQRQGGTRESYRLAAAPSEHGKQVTQAMVHDEATGISVDAVLRLDYRTDELQLQPISVYGLDRVVQLIVGSPALATPLKVDARLISGEPVTLSVGAGISERDVTELAMVVR